MSEYTGYNQMMGKRPPPIKNKTLTDEQQKMVIRKAMTLDKADKKKSEAELQKEVEELKLMRNRDEADIKMLKVELNKLDIVFKKYKDMGGLALSAQTGNIIELPERFLNMQQMQMNSDFQDQNTQEQAIVDTQTLLDDMNFVKNQIQCEIIRQKNKDKLQQQTRMADPNTIAQLQSIQSQNDRNLQNFMQNQGSLQSMSGASQSQVRLQINTLKTKCKLLQEQILKKDQEIQKLKQNSLAHQSEEKTKNELKRAYNILKALRKRLNNNKDYNSNHNSTHDQEYNLVIAQIQDALNLPKQPKEGQSENQINPSDLIAGISENHNTISNINAGETTVNELQDESSRIEDASLNELRQKIQDLKHELEMSPRQFEDKLLFKLREEIMISKQKMQQQLDLELEKEKQRLNNQALKSAQYTNDLRSGNQQMKAEVGRMKNALKNNRRQ